MRALLMAGLMLLAPLAGCLGSDDPDVPPGGAPGVAGNVTWAADALPLGEGHNHSLRSHHQNLSTPNFQTVGYDPLITDYHGETSGDYFCGETATEGERDVAVTHGFNNDLAFVLVDVSDPANPTKIGELALPYSHTYDVAVTPDGNYVALAISGADSGPDDGSAAAIPAEPGAGLSARYTDACGTTTRLQLPAETPYKAGVVLVDVTDPESPDIVDYDPQPALGPHSIFATQIDDTYHILASTTNLEHQASYFTFLGIESTLAGPQLVEQARYTAQQPGRSWEGDQPPLVNGHIDGWIQPHPVTDETIAYLANWNGGLHVVRLTDTGAQQIAVWNDYNASRGAGMTGQIHGALPMEETWNGTHYTFIGQEVGSRPAERPTGQIIMMDTTEPADPTPVARWTLPEDVEFDEALQFSTHYVEVVDRTMFVAMYHGGVWAVDVTPGAGPELPTEGVFVPDRTSPKPPDPGRLYADWAPTVLDVLALPNGDLVVFDGTSGVYTVRYDADHPLPEPKPWVEDAWIGNRTGGSGSLLPVG